MSASMRDELLRTARRLFAERGFDGVSLSAIAGEQGVSKQALLHHFSTKEKLYGEVLAAISAAYMTRLDAVERETDSGLARLHVFFAGLMPETPEAEMSVRLILRELLDNNRRAERASTWYLKGFLETLISWGRDVLGWEDTPDADILAVIYPIIGAVSYAAVSGPTLRGIFGDEPHETYRRRFQSQIERLVTESFAVRA